MCCGLGKEEVAWGWGGTVWNTLKEGGTEKLQIYDVYIYIVAGK